jgi:ribosomal-protein-serine acetyltransferase
MTDQRPIRIEAPREMSDGALVLRPWEQDDVPVFHRLVVGNLEHLRPFLFWAAETPAVEDYYALVERWRAENEAGTDWQCGIWLGGVAVGSTGLMQRREPGTLEIGYWVGRAYTRRGIARASSYLLTDLAFRQAGTDRVEIWHDRANVGSRRVPEGLGFELVSEQPADPSTPASPGEEGVDCVWRMTRKRWLDVRERLPRPAVRAAPVEGDK